MKNFLGWQAGSNMPSIYIHLSGDDMEDAVLIERYGLLDRKKNEYGLAVGRCARCDTVLPATAKYCQKCGLLLVNEGNELKTNNEALILNIIEFLKNNPEKLKLLKV